MNRGTMFLDKKSQSRPIETRRFSHIVLFTMSIEIHNCRGCSNSCHDTSRKQLADSFTHVVLCNHRFTQLRDLRPMTCTTLTFPKEYRSLHLISIQTNYPQYYPDFHDGISYLCNIVLVLWMGTFQCRQCQNSVPIKCMCKQVPDQNSAF